ncbi:MAG: hypothetical protein IRY99_23240 [Isosphaeraceae bacterium]|nr:hypothetical protein [Isosphaeraceae bacterium]
MTLPIAHPIPGDEMAEAVAGEARKGQAGEAIPCEVVPPGEEMEAVAQRWAQRYASLGPWNAFEKWLLSQVAVMGVRLERLRQAEAAMRTRRAYRAVLCWDIDRQYEAAVLAEKLPKSPARFAHELRQSKQGVELMIERWEALDRILQHYGGWDRAHWLLAMNLLGEPVPGRTSRLAGLDRDGLRALVQAELEALRALKRDVLEAQDLRERREVASGLGTDNSPEARRLRSEQASCRRWLLWVLQQLDPDYRGPASRSRRRRKGPTSASAS